MKSGVSDSHRTVRPCVQPRPLAMWSDSRSVPRRLRFRGPVRVAARVVSMAVAAMLLAGYGLAASESAATEAKDLREGPRLPQGLAVGDVSHDAAVLWTRAEAAVEVHTELSADESFSQPQQWNSRVDPTGDGIVQLAVDGLQPATIYHLRIRALDAEGRASPLLSGRFRTAPEPQAPVAVRFVVGGDLGGQGYCRQPQRGYDIFNAVAEGQPDFFIANGDMIYADNACPEQGPAGWTNIPGDFPGIGAANVDWSDRAEVAEVLRAHWRYNRSDPALRELLSHVPLFAQWDDHEVINDFGAAWTHYPPQPERAGYQTLVREGRAALFAYNPIARHPEESERIYRSFRWGQELEVFLLDNRSYRSRNDLPDGPGMGKAMLGQAQLSWLLEGLKASDATWKVVSTTVPLSAPTGSDSGRLGRDGFANGEEQDFSARTGAERELLALLRELDREQLRGLVFVATDVHFAMHLRYATDLDGDGRPLVWHELVSGPLNAVRAQTPPRLDPTLRPVILYAEGNLFNFSRLQIDPLPQGGSRLTAEIVDETGQVRVGSRLVLESLPKKESDRLADAGPEHRSGMARER